METIEGDRLNGLTGIDYLLNLNDRHSKLFSSEVAKGERQLFRSRHRLEILAYKCMDGRLNMSVMTQTRGLIVPMRNVGAKFRLGWPVVKDVVSEQYQYSLGKGRALLAITTYHFSRGDVHRGCAGFNEDTDAARAFASDFKTQHVRVFGQGKAFYTILVGLETDLDALVLHGDDESLSVDLSTVNDVSRENVVSLLRKLYPGMSAEMMEGFLPFVQGNIQHIQEVRKANRPITDIVHREWVLAFGRGFDWFHEPNTAIIVGPYDPELRSPISTAAELLLKNINEKRISDRGGVVVISSAPFRDRSGYDRWAACEKAVWGNEYVMDVIAKEVPDLMPHIKQLTAVMDMETRKLEILSQN